MPHHLMNLRNVPEDEAEEIRALFEAHGVAYYETPASRWGISMGGFWVHDADEAARARDLLAAYQAERQASQREAWRRAVSRGEVQGYWQRWRRRPVTMLATLLAIAIILGLALVPFLTL